MNDGQWHHIAGVYHGARISIYEDGRLDVSAKASGQVSVNDFPVLIGANAQVGERVFRAEARMGGREWNGWIDDVCIYSYALDAKDMSMLYRKTDAGNIAGNLHP